ncbi:hypothetical protein Ae201684P_019538 [Aphanomyces euteiches]|nr:hypothetical protein Ae201684P_019538 [Aphanomyces euteiches]
MENLVNDDMLSSGFMEVSNQTALSLIQREPVVRLDGSQSKVKHSLRPSQQLCPRLPELKMWMSASLALSSFGYWHGTDWRQHSSGQTWQLPVTTSSRRLLGYVEPREQTEIAIDITSKK